VFAGFDGDQLGMASNVYQYGKSEGNGLRFVRLGMSDLKLISDTKAQGIVQTESEPVVWLPSEKTTWVYQHPLGSDGWEQYTESGQRTGQELTHRNALSEGAVALEETKLLAFYGRYADGSVVSYNDHQTTELKLQCSPHPYGISADPAYAGAICTTQRDILPEAGGDKIITSEFLLLKAGGPTVVWRQQMNWVDVGYMNDGRGHDEGFQKGVPLIYRAGSNLVIVAPSKAPALTVYEIDAPH
jgi:hypothetical protein